MIRKQRNQNKSPSNNPRWEKLNSQYKDKNAAEVSIRPLHIGTSLSLKVMLCVSDIVGIHKNRLAENGHVFLVLCMCLVKQSTFADKIPLVFS